MSKTSHFCCRICGNDELESILSLGHMPLANAFLTKEQLGKPEAVYPLDLVFCTRCTLLQITETVSPETLFSDYYYLSSFSDTVLKFAEALSTSLIDMYQLNKSSLVIEIASNDGYLLQYYHKKHIPVLGIEPAQNIAQVAMEERGIDTISEFFDIELATQLKNANKRADVVHAHNVLAHVANLGEFVAGIHLLLKDNGVAVIEVPYVKSLIDYCQFDTIYHEHLCYFSLTALNHLFKQHSLCIQRVEQIPLHGGSLRLFVVKSTSAQQEVAVANMLNEEISWGVDRVEFYQAFTHRIKVLKRSLIDLLMALKRQGKSIAAYGAAAKGSTLLNHYNIGSELLDFVVDRSTQKQGCYMPGVHLHVCSPEKLLQQMPDFVLLLAWNLADEILAQQFEYRQQGGQFIIPIPEIRIVS